MSQRTALLDPRVARSQERLREALLSLTIEHGWDRVSVQQICARARVGRSTFYVHFADREDLLLAAFRSDHIAPPRTTSRERLGFVRPLIEHVGQHRALYAALVGTSCESAVNQRFGEVVAELIERDLALHATRRAPPTAAVRYLTGAFSETLTYWLEQRDGDTAAEVERMLKQYSQPVFDRFA